MVVDDLLQTYFPEKAAKLPYGDPVPLRQFAQNNSGIPDYANDIIMGCLPRSGIQRVFLTNSVSCHESAIVDVFNTS